jgi:hypothetical protein
MPSKKTMKQKAQSATASAPLKSTPPTPEAVGVVKSIEQLRSETAAAETFAKWAQSADDDDAPALLFYPKPTGKGVLSWKQKAAHDAQALVAALKAAEAAEAAEAAKPKQVLLPEDPEVMPEEEPSYVVPEESAEVVAARLARYAAESRSPSGMLLTHPSACSCDSCAPPKKRAVWSDAECQAVVDLWGWRLGAELILEQNEGWSLDDLYGAEMQQAWDQYMLALRETEVQREAEAKASEAARWRACVVQQAMVEARRNLKRGEVVQKNGRVCTRIYSCVGNKTTDWEDGGKKARPSTLHVSSECFAHAEFMAGRIRDDCPFLHCGDKGWHTEWDRNFLWDPAHPEVMPVAKHIRMRSGDYTTLCISEKSAGYLPVHLGGKPDGMDARQWRSSAPQPQRAEPQRQPQGRFAALAQPMMGGGSTPQPQSRVPHYVASRSQISKAGDALWAREMRELDEQFAGEGYEGEGPIPWDR